MCTLIILILCLFIVWFVRKYEQRQKIYSTEISSLKTTHENQMLQMQVEIQEQTFQNISREIHDNIGQKLTLAKLLIIKLHNNVDKDVLEASNIIGQAIGDLRNLSRTLSSDLVLNDGIIKAIQHEVDQYLKANRFVIEFEVVGETIFMEEIKEVFLFRIFQEAIQNIIKHSKATKVGITLKYRGDLLIAIIKDNGIGRLPQTENGLGLKNMETRAKLLGGRFSFESNELGTTVNISIPIP